MLRFLAELWRSARRPEIFRRCAIIALAVGTVLSAVNQGHLLFAGAIDVRVAARIATNYLVPFLVSNLGAMTSLPPGKK